VLAAVEVGAFVRYWLQAPGEVGSWLRSVVLLRAVEASVDLIARLFNEIETANEVNRALRERLKVANAEIDQLRAIRDALIAELRKPAGPNRSSSGALARITLTVILPVLVAVVGGAVAGVGQQLAANATSADAVVGTDESSILENLTELGEACRRVALLAEDDD
jgi:hypothetical protein